MPPVIFQQKVPKMLALFVQALLIKKTTEVNGAHPNYNIFHISTKYAKTLIVGLRQGSASGTGRGGLSVLARITLSNAFSFTSKKVTRMRYLLEHRFYHNFMFPFSLLRQTAYKGEWGQSSVFKLMILVKICFWAVST